MMTVFSFDFHDSSKCGVPSLKEQQKHRYADIQNRQSGLSSQALTCYLPFTDYESDQLDFDLCFLLIMHIKPVP